jgi:hypothetical protein
MRVSIHYNRGMETPDPLRCIDLPGEPLPELRRPCVHRVDQLHRDLAAAWRYPKENLPHSAGAQPAQQPVTTHAARITSSKSFHRQTQTPSHPPLEQT